MSSSPPPPPPPRPRTLLPLLLLLQLFATGTSQRCPTKPVNMEKQLKKCLLDNYDKSVRPAALTDTIQTAIHMHIRTLELDEHSSTLKIHAWTSWRWSDNNLKWNPDDFGKLRMIKMLSDDIWQPDVSLMTTEDASMHFGLPTTYCQVTNDGNVYCAPPTNFFGHCVPDVSRWPFDKHSCTLVMGSWTMLASRLNLTLTGPGVSIDQKLPSGVWDLKSYNARLVLSPQGNGEVYPSIDFTFELQRLSATEAATAVAPALVMSTMTLLTFLLEPGCIERLTLLGVNVLGHVLYLQFVSWRLPANGAAAPAIVVFFRDSLVLVGGALVLAIVTRRLVRARVPPPDWLRSLAASLLSHAPGQLLLLGRTSPRGAAATAGTAGEDGATLVAGDAGGVGGVDGQAARGGGGDDAWQQLDETWRLTAVFLDRVAMAVFLLALLSLYVRYVA